MPQLVGLKCVACRRTVASVIDGTFCPACGNPVHKFCLEQSREVSEGRCPSCGGDPNDPVALETQGERGMQLSVEQHRAVEAQIARGMQFGAEQAHPGAAAAREAIPRGPSPVSALCPTCGSNEFKKVFPEAWVAFIWDRVCKKCNTRYTPPTPVWATLLFIWGGALLGGLGGLSLLWELFSPRATALPAMACEACLTAMGILALAFGLRQMGRRPSSQETPPIQQEAAPPILDALPAPKPDESIREM